MRQYTDVLANEISKQQAAVDGLERALDTARAVLGAYIELQKKSTQQPAFVSATPAPVHPSQNGKGELRPGSAIYKARHVIEKAGHPLHIGEILIAIGKANNKANRISLSGSLSSYVRKREFFMRTGPNIFATVGMVVREMSTQESLPTTEGRLTQ